MNLHTVLGSRNRVKVLRVLSQSGGLSGRQVATLADISPSASKTSLEELRQVGLVLRSKERSRDSHELNRSHYLVPFLHQLFTEERRLPSRLADSIRRHLRGCKPSRELLCLGWNDGGELQLAMSPWVTADNPPDLEPLARELHYQIGVRIGSIVTHPGEIPAASRIWALALSDTPSQTDRQDRDRLLRFFGLEPPPAGP